ncbi:MAG: MBL fold metallo-hydrolase [Bacteroidetes bacterium]|nr:MAG: MBL fold metallo-hydrolase [Bacteroidota bacterium]
MEAVKTQSGLYIEQMYTGCLAEAAYYIESNGVAAVIDPMRETAPYVEKAAERGATIKYVFETHFHADFVSGHVDLANRTGAQIVYGPTATTDFDAIISEDGQVFRIGDITIEVLHTPGHTPESSCYLLRDENGKEYAVFTGDTMFIGEVGRPDLAVKSDLSQHDLAGMLYDSLRNKLMVLPDEVIVYPAHGAGSACGKNISDERWSTIGNQKQTNYALQPMDKEEFIKTVTHGIMPPPQYFSKNAMLNKKGTESIDKILSERVVPMEVAAVEAAMSEGALVLDTRSEEAFSTGHVAGSLFIGLDGSFASWVGTLIEDMKQPIVVITDEGREEEAVLRLARVGYNNALGYLKGGVKAWEAAGHTLATVENMTADQLAELSQQGKATIVDVRKPNEYKSEHVVDALSFPLDFINQHLNELDKDETYYLHCLGGYRSLIAASVLKQNGYTKLVNILGGWRAIQETNLPKTDYVCPSTL